MILGVLQARTDAPRLPGRAMKPILGMPMIGRQLERLARCESLDRLVVATSFDPSDDALAAYAESLGVRVFRGGVVDVLGRVQGAAIAHGPAAHVVHLNVACPLTDPAVVDACVWLHTTAAALKAAWHGASDPVERAQPTAYILNRPERFRLAQLVQSTPLSGRRWTVETAEDFEFVSRVFYMLYPTRPRFEQADVLGLSLEREAA
jgi:spore coat polysaccharide biosynthesis protein SpsF